MGGWLKQFNDGVCKGLKPPIPTDGDADRDSRYERYECAIEHTRDARSGMPKQRATHYWFPIDEKVSESCERHGRSGESE